jgi:REP element-mobilizing transposase RayT
MTRSRYGHNRDAVTSRLRLRGHDYNGPGTYFITICTNHRPCLFGTVHDGVMELSTAGLVVESWWLSIPLEFPDALLDAMVVMPNHIHGIVSLGTDPERIPQGSGQSLGDVVGWFKSHTTHDYIIGVRTDGWPRFRDKLWQEGYYEHIIRTDAAMKRIRTYIEANPGQWERDEYYAP